MNKPLVTKDRHAARRLLRREYAAAYLGLGANTFDKLVKAGEIPPPKHFVNAHVAVWDVVDLDACADALAYEDAAPDQSWND